jgi:hypothetical protein
LHLYIATHGLAKACREEVHSMVRQESLATAQKLEKLPLIFLDHADAVQSLKLTEWDGTDRWTEA